MSDPISPLHQHQADVAAARRKITADQLEQALAIHDEWVAEGCQLDLAEAIAEVAGLGQGSVEAIRDAAKLELLRERARKAREVEAAHGREDAAGSKAKTSAKGRPRSVAVLGTLLALCGITAGFLFSKLLGGSASAEIEGVEESSPSPSGEGAQGGLESPGADLSEDSTHPPDPKDGRSELSRLIERQGALERELVRLDAAIRKLSPDHPILRARRTSEAVPRPKDSVPPSPLEPATLEAMESQWREELAKAQDLEARGEWSEAIGVYQTLVQSAVGPVRDEARERFQDALQHLQEAPK